MSSYFSEKDINDVLSVSKVPASRSAKFSR